MRSLQVLLLTLALSPLAAAQSFNCKLAQSARERAVCASVKLSSLDTDVAAAYKSLRGQLSPESAALVQSDQREWLQWLDLVCPKHGKGIVANIYNCLGPEYSARLRDLKQITHFGNTLFFTRAHFVYKPGGKYYEPVNDTDPGFGSGSVRWPQIDIKPDIKPGRPSEAYALWNQIKARAFQLATPINGKAKPAGFDEAIVLGSTINATYNLAAANDRIIEVEFLDSAYPYGAAHPSTTYASSLWWLDRNRELTISDVFVLDSGWQQKLAGLAALDLASQPALQDKLDAKALNDWLAAGPAEFEAAPFNWILTRGGLTITFAESAIAPYALGMPRAHVLWKDLKPVLAKGLNPSTLPPPNPISTLYSGWPKLDY